MKEFSGLSLVAIGWTVCVLAGIYGWRCAITGDVRGAVAAFLIAGFCAIACKGVSESK